MDKIQEEVVYGCFRCGHKQVANDDLIRPTSCEDCGSPHLFTYQEALDLLNELHLKGKFKPKLIFEDDEYFYILDEA